MADLLSPGVLVKEKDLTTTVQNEPTSIGAVGIVSSKGYVNEVITLGTEGSVASTTGNRFVNVEYANTVGGEQTSKGFAFIWEDTDHDGQIRFGELDGTTISWAATEEFAGDTSVQRMGLTYDDDANWFVIVYKDHNTNPGGQARTFATAIPEFGNIMMPIISVLAIVGLKYQRKE